VVESISSRSAFTSEPGSLLFSAAVLAGVDSVAGVTLSTFGFSVDEAGSARRARVLSGAGDGLASVFAGRGLLAGELACEGLGDGLGCCGMLSKVLCEKAVAALKTITTANREATEPTWIALEIFTALPFMKSELSAHLRSLGASARTYARIVPPKPTAHPCVRLAKNTRSNGWVVPLGSTVQ
jgi:hypothetical protein